jgi:hypothetical protein
MVFRWSVAAKQTSNARQSGARSQWTPWRRELHTCRLQEVGEEFHRSERFLRNRGIQASPHRAHRGGKKVA